MTRERLFFVLRKLVFLAIYVVAIPLTIIGFLIFLMIVPW